MVQIDIDRAAAMPDTPSAEPRARQKILSDAVRATFGRVPRVRFMPADTGLTVPYSHDIAVVTKHDQHDRATSSVSAGSHPGRDAGAGRATSRQGGPRRMRDHLIGMAPTIVHAWRNPQRRNLRPSAPIAAGAITAGLAAYGDWTTTAQ